VQKNEKSNRPRQIRNLRWSICVALKLSNCKLILRNWKVGDFHIQCAEAIHYKAYEKDGPYWRSNLAQDKGGVAAAIPHYNGLARRFQALANGWQQPAWLTGFVQQQTLEALYLERPNELQQSLQQQKNTFESFFAAELGRLSVQSNDWLSAGYSSVQGETRPFSYSGGLLAQYQEGSAQSLQQESLQPREHRLRF
jgi:hypothetical protein